MTIVKATTLRAPVSGQLAQGTITFRSPFDQPVADGSVLMKNLGKPVNIVNGVFPDTDLPAGSLEVKIAIVGASRSSDRLWQPVVVPASGPVELYTLLAQFTQWTTPVVSQAVMAAQSAATYRDQAAASAVAAQAAAGQVPPDDSITRPKLEPAVRTSLGKADSAVQPAALTSKADLDGNGKVPQAQIPAVALTDFLGAVATQSAMLGLTGQRGDWCTRTDRGTDWQLIAEPSTTLTSWRERTYPASPVSTVNGRTGAVTTSSDDITDATTVGKTLIKAADPATARAAIGAGTVTASDLAASQLVPSNPQTGAYTLALADAMKAVEVTSSSATSVTVPANSTAAFPIGTVIEVVQAGTGQVTLTPASGVTLNTSASLMTRTQWSSVALRKRGSDAWIVAGDTQ